jgi:S1-C subfamily serine protease
MADSSPSRGPARETRLLLLTLFVSVAVLFLLARFRFPERPITDLSPPQPLTRLGRPLAFDELSGSLTDLLRRFDASVVVLRVAGGAPGAGAGAGSAASAGMTVWLPGSGGPGGIGGPGGPRGSGGPGGSGSASSDSSEASRLLPALRVRDDLVLAPLSPGERVTGVGGGAGDDVAAAQAVVARDELRGLAVVRVPPRAAPVLSLLPQNEPLEVPGYVAVLEASPGGPIIRAEFASTLARAERPGWDAPAVLIGGVQRAQRGALLFSLGGRFVGMVLDDAGGAAVVAPGEALMARVDSLARGESIRLAQPGFIVQPLSLALSKASGAAAGVMVSGLVSAASRAASGSGSATMRTVGQADASAIDLGDVITGADGQPVRSLNDWQRLLARHAAGASLPLDVMRFGKPLRLTIALAAGAAPDSPGLGASFRPATGGALEIVSVDPTGPAARAGLQPGDRVTALLPARGALTPARLAAVFAALKPGDTLVLALDRQNGSRVAAVEKR